eukprot:6486685-Amphidinium_carterae.1
MSVSKEARLAQNVLRTSEASFCMLWLSSFDDDAALMQGISCYLYVAACSPYGVSSTVELECGVSRPQCEPSSPIVGGASAWVWACMKQQNPHLGGVILLA